MTYTVEVEQDGSLTLSREVVSETLRLAPGTKVSVEPEPDGSAVSLRPVELDEGGPEAASTRLYWKDGVLVYDAPGADPDYDIVGAIRKMREERMKHVAGLGMDTLS